MLYPIIAEHVVRYLMMTFCFDWLSKTVGTENKYAKDILL